MEGSLFFTHFSFYLATGSLLMVEFPSLCRNTVMGTNILVEYCGNFSKLFLFVTQRSTNPGIQYCSVSTVNVRMA